MVYLFVCVTVLLRQAGKELLVIQLSIFVRIKLSEYSLKLRELFLGCHARRHHREHRLLQLLCCVELHHVRKRLIHRNFVNLRILCVLEPRIAEQFKSRGALLRIFCQQPPDKIYCHRADLNPDRLGEI